MTLFIKNMVCDRCKMVVRQTAEATGLQPLTVELGEVKLAQPPEPEQLAAFRESLETAGFRLLDDPRQQLTGRIKAAVVELVHYHDDDRRVNLSEYLAQRLGRDYGSLSTVFSETEGTTIEQYLIRQKIERVKELLGYDQLSLSQIADQLHYSSVAHLSAQFKKVTGLTTRAFKRSNQEKRLSLDRV